MNKSEFSRNAGGLLSILADYIPPEILKPLLEALGDPECAKFDRLLFLVAAFILKTAAAVM